MKKKYIGKGSLLTLINNKVYDVIYVEKGWYRIIDETGEDYLYPSELFVEEGETGYIDMSVSDYILSLPE